MMRFGLCVMRFGMRFAINKKHDYRIIILEDQRSVYFVLADLLNTHGYHIAYNILSANSNLFLIFLSASAR